jgi:hypothetical protein
LEINFRRQCIKQDINKPWCFWNKVILCLFDGVSTLFQLYIMAVSFMDGGNRRTQRKPRPVARHWQTLSLNVVIVHLAMSVIQTHNICGESHWLHR